MQRVAIGSISILDICCILPLLECINNLVTVAQNMDVFICGIVATMKGVPNIVVHLYNDKSNTFSTD